MGRPAGSKNKPKRVLLNRAQVELAQREGIKLEKLAEDIKKSQRKPRAVKKKIDWEVLAKQLQQALASEIKENDGLKKEVERLRISIVKMGGVIEFLEIKRGNNPV